MSQKKPREVFKEMLNLCYDEDYPELHKELVSLESDVRSEKGKQKYEVAMEEILSIIPLFADDFPIDTFAQVEALYQDFMEENY